MYLFLSALLLLSPIPDTVSLNEIPVEESLLLDDTVSDNTDNPDVPENPDIPESSEETPLPDEESEEEDENVYVPVEKPDMPRDVEDSILSELEKIPVEVTENIEVTVTVSDNSVSGNSVSANDVSAVNESLMMINDNMELLLAAIEPTVSAYQVSDYYREYFKGVLQNMPHTEYLCYAERIYTGNNYITHYYLMYDLVLEDGLVVAGSYPCFDVYSSNNIYYMDEITKDFDGYPTFGFASFAPYSALVDRSFHFNDLYVGLICVAVLFVISRKTVFS